MFICIFCLLHLEEWRVQKGVQKEVQEGGPEGVQFCTVLSSLHCSACSMTGCYSEATSIFLLFVSLNSLLFLYAKRDF